MNEGVRLKEESRLRMKAMSKDVLTHLNEPKYASEDERIV